MLNSSILFQEKSLHIIIMTSELLSRNFPGGPEGRINSALRERLTSSAAAHVWRHSAGHSHRSVSPRRDLHKSTQLQWTSRITRTEVNVRRERERRGLRHLSVSASLQTCSNSRAGVSTAPVSAVLCFLFHPLLPDPQSHEWEKSLCSQSDFITHRHKRREHNDRHGLDF